MKNPFKSIKLSDNAAAAIRAAWSVQQNIFVIVCILFIAVLLPDALRDPEFVAAAQKTDISGRLVWAAGVLYAFFLLSLVLSIIHLAMIGAPTLLAVFVRIDERKPPADDAAPES